MSEEYRYEGDVNYDPYNGAPDVAGAGMPVAANRAEGDVNYDPYNGDAGAGGYRTGKRPQAGYATDGADGDGPGTGASSDDGPGARHGEAKQLTPEQEAVMGYDEQIEALKAAAEATRDETPEQRKKRERLERSRKIVGAVTDGLSALGNLFFAARYAPNMYNPQHSALGKVAGSIERAKAEREANADRHLNYMLRLGDARMARAKTLRDMAAQHEAQRLARERAERDAEEHGWKAALQDDIKRKHKGEADRAESQAVSAQVQAQYAPLIEQGKVALNDARVATEGTRQKANVASAANSYAHAKKAGQDGVYGTFDGVEYYNKRDYDKEVLAAARSYNTRNAVKVKKTKKDASGNDVEYEETEYPVKVDWIEETAYGEKPHLYDAEDIAAELEPLLRKERNRGGGTTNPAAKPAGTTTTNAGKKWSNTSQIKW